MYRIHFGELIGEPNRKVLVSDDAGVVTWSGQTMIGALRHLADWGQGTALIDVDGAIWFFGPEGKG